MRSIAAPSDNVFRKITWRETTLLLTVAWLVPFLVHWVPGPDARPLGAYLLPMFWTTFVAIYFYGAGFGLLTGVFATAVNLLVAGFPAWRAFGVMSIELVVFSLVVAWAVRRLPRYWLLAPGAYLVAKTCSTLVQFPATVLGSATAPARFVASALTSGAAGLLALAAINGALVWLYPKQTEVD